MARTKPRYAKDAQGRNIYPDEVRREALRRLRAGESRGSIADDLGLAGPTQLDNWRRAEGKRAAGGQGKRERAANDSPGPDTPPGTVPSNVNSFAAPLPFPSSDPAPLQAEFADEPSEMGVEVHGFSLQIEGLPTRPTLERRMVTKVHSNTRPKPLILRAECPHCGNSLPPPPRPEPGRLIAVQFACPLCDGLVVLP